MMNTVFFLLGANLGNPLKQLQAAIYEIGMRIGTVCQCSQIYESKAWGVTDQPAFLNLVAEVNTSFTPLKTLELVQDIENDLGRVRLSKWGARFIDIDILYFNAEVVDTDNLSIPHPYIQDRRFTLVPLCELAPGFVHPVLQKSNQELLTQCNDTLQVKPFITPQNV